MQPIRRGAAAACGMAMTWLVTVGSVAGAGEPARMVTGTVEGRQVTALELVSAPSRQILLGTDGWIHDFDPGRSETELRMHAGVFTPLPAATLRQQLQREFGPEFEVAMTAHYLVVQPRGAGDRWPETFERLHRAFTTYFSLRGLRVRRGNFPMVAIVLPDERSMHNELRRLDIDLTDVLGVYDGASNRIVMYDHGAAAYGSAGVNAAASAQQHAAVAATICHEAAHQSAFNTGVHSRLTATPHWIVEGIGCLFQGPGFLAGRPGGTVADRCDPEMLRAFRSAYAGRPERIAADLQSLVESDVLFSGSGTRADAYALSWAATLFLSERYQQQWIALLESTARRAPLREYSAAERRADFRTLVGTSEEALAGQMDRFFQQM